MNTEVLSILRHTSKSQDHVTFQFLKKTLSNLVMAISAVTKLKHFIVQKDVPVRKTFVDIYCYLVEASNCRFTVTINTNLVLNIYDLVIDKVEKTKFLGVISNSSLTGMIT